MLLYLFGIYVLFFPAHYQSKRQGKILRGVKGGKLGSFIYLFIFFSFTLFTFEVLISEGRPVLVLPPQK